ncbi:MULTISPECIES: hypothetical protein [unclassified Microbacterium]|uniref:hypothetical protein n=1 Tax=unclassified Microbacterium TaxID=2609290 RepID=UPI003868EE69
MSMDIRATVEPKSDQLNFDDVAATGMVITIDRVKQGPPDQPVELHNTEHPGRPYKPGKSMRRVLIAAWGTDASKYVGRRIEIYGDPTIKFGADAVGGIRIRALSHITEPLTVPLTLTRGKRAPFTVKPLTEPATHLVKILRAADTVDALKAAWDMVTQQGHSGNRELVALKDKRKTELASEAAPEAE